MSQNWQQEDTDPFCPMSQNWQQENTDPFCPMSHNWQQDSTYSAPGQSIGGSSAQAFHPIGSAASNMIPVMYPGPHQLFVVGVPFPATQGQIIPVQSTLQPNDLPSSSSFQLFQIISNPVQLLSNPITPVTHFPVESYISPVIPPLESTEQTGPLPFTADEAPTQAVEPAATAPAYPGPDSDQTKKAERIGEFFNSAPEASQVEFFFKAKVGEFTQAQPDESAWKELQEFLEGFKLMLSEFQLNTNATQRKDRSRLSILAHLKSKISFNSTEKVLEFERNLRRFINKLFLEEDCQTPQSTSVQFQDIDGSNNSFRKPRHRLQLFDIILQKDGKEVNRLQKQQGPTVETESERTVKTISERDVKGQKYFECLKSIADSMEKKFTFLIYNLKGRDIHKDRDAIVSRLQSIEHQRQLQSVLKETGMRVIGAPTMDTPKPWIYIGVYVEKPPKSAQHFLEIDEKIKEALHDCLKEQLKNTRVQLKDINCVPRTISKHRETTSSSSHHPQRCLAQSSSSSSSHHPSQRRVVKTGK
jgi:hypothetical protein